MLRASVLLAALLLAVAPAASAQAPAIPAADRVRLAEAFRLSDRIGERVWPGWRAVPMPVLLVTDSTEYLIGHPAPSADFVPLGRDTLLGRDVLVRPRRLPTGMLATFPAVGGVPTIVVGTAPATSRSSAMWVVTLLHEHFHQLQYARPGYWNGVAALGLARGDTTGMWMLEYPFPYDDARVRDAAARLAEALRGRDRKAAANAWHALADPLAPDDHRYLEFQLWQEGVARWVEYAAVREAVRDGGRSAAAYRALPDHEEWSALAERQARDLEQELAQPLAGLRRVAFYPLGAAIALLLDAQGSSWKERYERSPFRLGEQLDPPP